MTINRCQFFFVFFDVLPVGVFNMLISLTQKKCNTSNCKYNSNEMTEFVQHLYYWIAKNVM